MTERRRPRVQIGRRRSDIPLKILEQFRDEIKAHVAETIKVTVNGKIDNLKQTMLTTENFDTYVKDDTAWKKANEPALENMKNLTGLGKFILGGVVSIGALLAGIASIQAYFKK